MFLEINALVILVMIVFFFFHEVTALLDLSYASATRKVGPIEQPVHSFLEMLPLMGLLMIMFFIGRSSFPCWASPPRTSSFG
jgi:hypothetical protein